MGRDLELISLKVTGMEISFSSLSSIPGSGEWKQNTHLGFEGKVLGLGVGPGWFVGGARYGRGGVEPAVEVYHR